MPSSLMGVKDIPISKHRATHALSRAANINTKEKATPQDGFGNDFGNKGVVSLQTLVIPIDLAETRGFEPPIRVLAPMLP
jgi:hypothetical protein